MLVGKAKGIGNRLPGLRKDDHFSAMCLMMRLIAGVQIYFRLRRRNLLCAVDHSEPLKDFCCH
jgi:hypothetical protein